MAVGIKDISKKLKLSPSTVSRALNNKRALNSRGVPYISDKTVARVMKAAQELNYSPNGTARALVTGQTGRIAFWSPSMGSRFFQEVAYQFHQILRESQYEMLVGEFGPHMMDPANTVGFTRIDVDGVIVWGGALGALKPVLESNFPAKAPIVNMGLHCDGTLDFVNIDLYPASCEATKFLLDEGRSRVAMMITPATETEFDGRYRGYTEVMKERGLEVEFLHSPDSTRNAARATILKYVKKHGCPDGLFCANDEMGIGAYRGLRDMGISIPDQVTLVGCDGIQDLEFLDPPVSTIAQPIEEMCEQAWNFLKQRMKNSEMPHQTETLQAHLVIRK